MGVKRVEDLIALQQAVLLKEGVYVLVRTSPPAMRDWKWRDTADKCTPLLEHERRCGSAMRALRKSLEPYIDRSRRRQ